MDRATRVALPVVLLALAAALSLQQIRTWDYWWHLKSGEIIAKTGEVPKTDPFTYSAAGKRWVNPHWLFQVGLYGVHRVGGHAGVVVAKALGVLVLLGLLVAAGGRRDRHTLVAAALALALVAASDRIMVRPEVPSFVLLAATLALLERFRRTGDAWIYALVPLLGIWANVQSLFPLGLVVLALAFVGELGEGLLRGGSRAPRLRRLASVGLLSGLVCLLNPNGLDGALFPLQTARVMSGAGAEVGLRAQEVRATVVHWQSVPPPILAAALLLAALSGASMALRWRRVPLADVGVWSVFGVLAALSIRNLALFAVAAAPILIRNGSALLDGRNVPDAARRAAAWGVTACMAGFALIALRPGWGFEMVREPGFGVMERRLPVAAADWLLREGPRGRIYHHMGHGGYLIWRLHPEFPVLSDGRLEFHGPAMAELGASDTAGFRALDRRFGFEAAILGYGVFDFQELLRWLHDSPEWRLAFVDESAAVFVRRAPGDARADLDVDDPGLFPPLDPDPERNLDDQQRRISRARFYAALGRRRLAWREAAELDRLYGMGLPGIDRH